MKSPFMFGLILSLAVSPPVEILSCGNDLDETAGSNPPLVEGPRDARLRGAAPHFGENWIVPELRLEMVWIEPGDFLMGSPPGEEGRDADERLHSVILRTGFWLGKYEVTLGEWEGLMKKKGEELPLAGRRRPVTLSWQEAMAYAGKLTARERAKGRLPVGFTYTLPTEAQWEYACRAGARTAFPDGNRLSAKEANFDGNFPYGGAPKGRFRGKAVSVGSYKPNRWGLYDMRGNVWEWCYDWYVPDLSGYAEDPAGPPAGTDKVVRGGSWFDNGNYCRCAARVMREPSQKRDNLGFRLALSMCSP